MNKGSVLAAIVSALFILSACGGSTAVPEVPQRQPISSPGAASETFEFQYACIALRSSPCQLLQSFFIPQVEARTEGRLKMTVASFSELGLDGPDTLRLIENGSLDSGEILSVYIAGDLPIVEIDNLMGLYPDAETQQRVTDAVRADIERIITERTGGGKILAYQYYPDLFFFSKNKVLSMEDFEGLKVRQPGGVLSDLIVGLGGQPQFISVAEVYTALDRGVVDAGVTEGTAGWGQRWHEVTDYLVGPIVGHPHSWMTVNANQWNALPEVLQQVLIEVGQEYERENLKLVAQWDQDAIDRNVAEGMVYIPFTTEVADGLRQAVLEKVLPGWVARVGGPESEGVRLFNSKVAPIVKVRVNPDGTVSEFE